MLICFTLLLAVASSIASLALWAAKDGHDALYGLGRHRDPCWSTPVEESAGQANPRDTPVTLLVAIVPAPTLTRIDALLPHPATAPA